jgi:hypothetical protein
VAADLKEIKGGDPGGDGGIRTPDTALHCITV